MSTVPATPPSHVVIAGQGRCGSNWLLEIFGLSPATHCRNDANAFAGSPFVRLPSPVVWDERNSARLDAGWDEALRWVREHGGERDPRTAVRKNHLHEISRVLGLVALVERPRSRRLLAAIAPELRGEEWLLPRWLGDRGKLGRALLVMKLGLPAGWMPWILQRRTDAHVIHLTRHPGGYLTSWSARFLTQRDLGAITRANRERLREVGSVDGSWARRFGDCAAMSAEEAEMWYWLYSTETIHRAAANSPQHTLVSYEDLLRDVVGVARPLYERMGLEWNAEIEGRIRATVSRPPQYADAWRERISSEHLDMLERILTSSPCASWWPSARGK